MKGEVLLVMSNDALRKSLEEKVRSAGWRVASAVSTDGLLDAIRRLHPDVVVLDPSLCAFGASVTVGVLKEIQTDVRIIIHTETPAESDAEIVERGVFYYAGNCDIDTLFGAVESALRCVARRANWSSP